MIEMKCPRCGTRLTFEDAAAGTTVQCTICTVPIEVPAAEAPPPAPETPLDLEAPAPVPDYAPADTFDIDDGRQTAAALRDELASPEMEEIRLLAVRPAFWANGLLAWGASMVCLFSLASAVPTFRSGKTDAGVLLLLLCLASLATVILWVRYCVSRRLILTTHRTILETGRGEKKRTLQVRNADISFVNAEHQYTRYGRVNWGKLTVVARPLKLEIGPITRLTYVAAAIRGAAHRARAREDAGEVWEPSTD
ncbi:MAG TPA: TFIIB-type zinc ribbon-containing protein [Planctomycetota bacterium]|nr:TFIIB-type zinc ribbon-containing protein [Planctomycetota bacterium]